MLTITRYIDFSQKNTFDFFGIFIIFRIGNIILSRIKENLVCISYLATVVYPPAPINIELLEIKLVLLSRET